MQAFLKLKQLDLEFDKRYIMNYLEKFRYIRTFIFDVDGVLTDGKIILAESGQQLRAMNVKDGYAIKQALNQSYNVVIISGAYSEGVANRLDYLGVEDYFLGVDDKVDIFEDYIESRNLDAGEVLFMGDDLPDYPLMRLVGLPVCPSDAVPEVLDLAQYVSPHKGGDACVRDVIEKVMRLQGKWLPWQQVASAEHTTDSNES